jgi:THO complex subunit 1
MAVPDVASSDVMVASLEELLQRAREVKQSTSIDPPLQVSEIASESGPIFGKVPKDTSDLHSVAFERAAKKIFYSELVRYLDALQFKITNTYQGSSRIEDGSFVNVWNLLDILQYCGDRSRYIPSYPCAPPNRSRQMFATTSIASYRGATR